MWPNSDYSRSLLMTVAAVLCWSIGGLGIRIANVSKWGIIFWRSTFMGLAILSFLIIRDRKDTFQTFKKIGIPGLAAGAFLAIAFTFFVLSISRTSVANTLILQGASSLFAALFGWLILHERVRAKTWLAIIVTMAGVAIMISDSLATGEFLGDVLGLVVGIALASNIVVVRATRDVDIIPAACLGGFFVSSTSHPNDEYFYDPRARSLYFGCSRFNSIRAWFLFVCNWITQFTACSDRPPNITGGSSWTHLGLTFYR